MSISTMLNRNLFLFGTRTYYLFTVRLLVPKPRPLLVWMKLTSVWVTMVWFNLTQKRFLMEAPPPGANLIITLPTPPTCEDIGEMGATTFIVTDLNTDAFLLLAH